MSGDSRAPGRNPPVPMPKDALPDEEREVPTDDRPPAVPAEPVTTRIDVGRPDGQSPHIHQEETP